MSDSKIALALGFAGLVMLSAITWHKDATRCRVIESDPLGILIAPR